MKCHLGYYHQSKCEMDATQLTFTCSKSVIETAENVVKYVQS